MDEQKKEVSAQVQPETAETLQTDEINVRLYRSNRRKPKWRRSRQ